MDVPSQSSSQVHIYSCKWAWCRSVFEDHPSLVHHVVHDHARRSIPVRRRDISMIRRAEEGSGESLKISYLMSGTESSTQASEKPVSQSSQINLPTSSLPSPPNSSPVNGSPQSPVERLSGDVESPSPSSSLVNHSAGDGMHAFAQPTTPDIALRFLPQAVESTPTFASLSSPADSPAPLAIPNSPAFSSLISSKKRKLVFHIPENATPPKSYYSRNHPLSQSSISQSSTGSQMSVEMQLTQSLEEQDEDISDPDAMGEDEDETPEFHLPESDPQSEPQLDSFPIHFHKPKSCSPTVSQPTQPEFDSNAPPQLSSPAPLASPPFAASTPQRQNWYQSTVVRKRGKKQESEDDLVKLTHSLSKSDASPSQSSDRRSRTPRSKSAHRPKKFRSGTLQIKTVATLPEPIPEGSETFEPPGQDQIMLQDVDEVDGNNSPQSYMDSDSQSTQDYSYPPLQTQAPYQSQYLSQ